MESFLGDPKANLISIFLDSYDPKKKIKHQIKLTIDMNKAQHFMSNILQYSI